MRSSLSAASALVPALLAVLVFVQTADAGGRSATPPEALLAEDTCEVREAMIGPLERLDPADAWKPAPEKPWNLKWAADLCMLFGAGCIQ